MVKLVCAIIGEVGRSAFSVRVDEDDSVDDLKKAIKAEKQNVLNDVDPDELQLFLAKKDGVWLPDDDTLDAMLQSKVDTSAYMKMRASWRLNKTSLFGPNISLGEDVIHVLVVVPEGAGSQAGVTAFP
ncbi:Crinkler (CRN), partial [Phytophthora megakarya]